MVPKASPASGYLAFVLHAHLPYVRHPEWEEAIEERWLFEAIAECYLPLLERFRRMRDDGVAFRLTMSLTPPLIAMLRDDLLRGRAERHLGRLVDLSEREVGRTRDDGAFGPVARFYRDRLGGLLDLWKSLGGDLVGAFADLERTGHVELMTCGATHGFLPLLAEAPGAVRRQIRAACAFHASEIGHRPRGIWLPECAFVPEPELLDALASEGLRFFVVDTHAIDNATPRPRRSVFAPVYLPNGVAAFGRDPESSKQVWSADEGYPGDFAYRDFYRDRGYDAPEEDLRELRHPTGIRLMTGLKYHRITRRGAGDKEPYDPARARDQVATHAGHFLFCRQRQIEWLAGDGRPAVAAELDHPPIVVSPYDAELFGHWWFEGPDFLEYFFRKAHFDQKDVLPVTLAEYLERHPIQQVAMPSASSWGAGGYNAVWCEGTNAWIWRHLHEVERALGEPGANRALRAREVLLAESSDWPFILKTGTSVGYARARVGAHLARARRLGDPAAPADWAAEVANRDQIFRGLSEADLEVA